MEWETLVNAFVPIRHNCVVHFVVAANTMPTVERQGPTGKASIKGAAKKKAKVFSIDCSKPVNDKVMDITSFEEFLQGHIKVDGKTGRRSHTMRSAKKCDRLFRKFRRSGESDTRQNENLHLDGSGFLKEVSST